MTTLLISEIFPPKTGGSGRWFWEIYRRLPREEFAVVAGDWLGAQELDKGYELEVRRLPLSMSAWGLRSFAGMRGYWSLFRRLTHEILRRRAKTLHAARCLPEGWLAYMLRLAMGVRYAVYVHGEDIQSAATSRELRWMVRKVFSSASLIVANSRNTARLLEEDWGRWAAGKVQVLYPGVDTIHFCPAPRDTNVRSRLDWNDRPVILTVGRLQKRKGHDQLIEALSQIRHDVPDVLYAIAGDGEERQPLKQLVENLNLTKHVQFLGEIDDDQLVQCYQQCDLFALPNRQVGHDIEGFGMVLVEAQACGRPVVAGTSGGTAETMAVEISGRLVDCNQVEQLAAACSQLLQDAELRQAMGEAARRWVSERFCWERLSVQAGELFVSPLRAARSRHLTRAPVLAGPVDSSSTSSEQV